MGLRFWRRRPEVEPEEYFPEIPPPKVVTAGQVELARFQVLRDNARGRKTPAWILKIAAVRLDDDPPAQPQA